MVITARCGEYTATCTVSVSRVLSAYSICNGEWVEGTEGESESQYVARTAGVGADAGIYGSFYSTTATPSGYKARHTNNSIFPNDVYPIMLPKGCTKITSSGVPSGVKMTLRECDSTETTGTSDHAIRALTNTTAWKSGISNGDRTAQIPSGADSVFVNFYSSGKTLTQEILAAITLTAS